MIEYTFMHMCACILAIIVTNYTFLRPSVRGIPMFSKDRPIDLSVGNFRFNHRFKIQHGTLSRKSHRTQVLLSAADLDLDDSTAC